MTSQAPFLWEQDENIGFRPLGDGDVEVELHGGSDFWDFSGDDGELPLLYGVRVRTYDARYSEES